jgi:rfaE bifunctional protein nucleotidyltransferase chain/domain
VSIRPEDRIFTTDELIARFGRPRDGRLVFTNGCFDLLHRGHVAYLAEARALGEALVVGVNTDASFRRLGKGPGRPVVAEEDRAYLLAALTGVDGVCLFDEDTPRALIARLLPDVLVKGGDYRLGDVVGREEVETSGGSVVLIPFVEGYSTTELIRRIREET